MKKMLITVLLALFLAGAWAVVVSADTGGWTWLNPLPQGNRLRDVWGTSPNNVYAVGDVGTIMHYDGSAWQVVDTPTRQDLYAIWGTGPNNIYAVGDDVMLHYDGTAWSSVPLPRRPSGRPYLLRAIWGSGPNDIWAGGGELLHYDGHQWKIREVPLCYGIDALWGTGPKNVYATTGNVVCRYDGKYWRRVYENPDVRLYDIWGLAADDIYMVGEMSDKPVVVHHDGSTWQTVYEGENTYVSFYSIWGPAPDNLYVTADNGVHHYDGTQWTRLERVGLESRFRQVWGTGPTDIFFVGWLGEIDHYDGSHWQRHTQGFPEPLETVWTDGSVVVVGGNRGFVAMYDGGEWHTIPISTYMDVTDIWGIYHTTLFAATEDNVIYFYDRQTWREMKTGAGLFTMFFGLWGTGADDVYAVGGQIYPERQAIAHYDGLRWTTVYTAEAPALTAAWGTGSDDVFAVGYDGVVLHYDGQAWNAMDSGAMYPLRSVWGTSGDNVYAVGDIGTLIHYDGQQWQTIDLGTYEGLEAVWGRGPDDVYVVGMSGTMFHFDGSTWTELPSPTTNLLSDITGAGDVLFMVGGGGTVLSKGTLPAVTYRHLYMPYAIR